MILKPWMIWSGQDDWLVCMMCPTDRSDKAGNVAFRAINTSKKTRRQIDRWYLAHRQCGFQGDSELVQ